ncbi:hypothetical protein FACS1894201_01460 [Bacteroidia bacterium]|nr:hypothetical protein FACS1894201_01460 [Bacteroidia bacterium]
MTSVEIPNSVTIIGGNAFNGCSGLTSVDIGNSVTDIGSSAFEGCSGLTSVEIPNSVTNIGGNAFTYCSGLILINAETDNLRYKSESGVLYTKAMDTLVTYPGGKTGAFTIPNSVTSIGSVAFNGCSRLTGSLTIPNSVTSIGHYAFSGCSGLTGSLTIPNSVTSIGYYAFEGCSGLTSVEIGNSVTDIWGYAFSGCIGLTGSLTIPNSVTDIGQSAFNGCSGLTSVEIGNSVTEIESSAFNGCSGLTSVEIGNSVTFIRSSAFNGCSGLTSVINLNPVPQTITIDVFTNGSTLSSDILYVPGGSLAAYQAANVWKNFGTILKIGSRTDAYLSALSVSTGTLSPVFNADTTNYTVEVPSSTTSLTISATKSSTVATVSGTGSKSLAIGLNTFNVIVTAQDGVTQKTYTITVTRATPVSVTSVSLNKTATTLLIGGTETLTATILPANATNKNITWNSNNTSVATVNSSGVVTGVSAGNATIRVTTVDGSFNDTCVVTVSTVAVTSVSLNKTATTLAVGGTETLTATVLPANATNQNVTWSSSNTSIARVSNNGLVTAVSGGNATITVTTADGSHTATCATVVEGKVAPFTETFESGSSTSLSGWAFANGSQTNKWYIGTATSYDGAKSAYISNNSGSNAYTRSSSSVVHLYCDVVLPQAAANDYRLTFNWKGYGENNYDDLKVYLVETTTTPAAGASLNSTYLLGTYGLSNTWTSDTINIPASSTAKRLVFTWRNDNMDGSAPPAAIDNISIQPILPVLVTNASNTGTGSLRNAIANAVAGDVIEFNPAVNWKDSVITLASQLGITKNLTIEGNGVTISGNNAYRILYLGSPDSGTILTVNRVRFINGSHTLYGAAIYCSGGTLNLQNCIFSNNRSTNTSTFYGGGAIFFESNGILNIKGCTFYNNTASTRGGAICLSSGTPLTLTGNLFYGNTASYSGNDVYNSSGTVVSGGYNVYGSTLYTNSTGDKLVTSATFNTTTFVPNATGESNIKIAPSGVLPGVDFYGVSRTVFPTYAGAVVIAPRIFVTSVSLNKTATTLLIGGTETLTATILPANATNKNVTWSSSNTSVATVNSRGVVTAVSAGNATITVTTADGGYMAQCEVAVLSEFLSVLLHPQSELVSVSQGSYSWYAGTDYVYSGNSGYHNTTSSFSTTVSNIDSITVSFEWAVGSESNYDYFKFYIDGTERISYSGSRTFYTSYSVKLPAGSHSLVWQYSKDDSESSSWDGARVRQLMVTYRKPVTGVTLNKTATTLVFGGTETLTATVLPANATNQNVTWSSSNTSIATVSNNGLVTAVSGGNATITVTTADGSHTATCATVVEGKVAPFTETFESGSSTSLSGWAFANGSQTNKWYIGTATSYNGTKSAYISNNSNSNAYTISSTSVVHLYSDITFPTSSEAYTLTFYWKGNGESRYDDLTVYMLTTSTTPIAGTSLSGIALGTYNGQSSWQQARITLPAATYSGTTKRLVFTWRNDGSMGTQSPIAIDDIAISSVPASIPVTSVSLNKTSTTLLIGGTETLTATVLPANATNKNITWSSNNTSVATVNSSGVVTAVSAGSATITATTASGSRTATCAVTVTAVTPTSVSLSRITDTLTIGGTRTLSATVLPANATNKNITWSSNNTSVATVNSSGLVTAVSAGNATITVTTADGSRTATCTVTVSATNISVTGVSLNKTATILAVTGTETLTATVLPANATNKNVTWSSSNTSIATVSSSGVVTAVSAGNATITVTTADGSRTATCTVTVSAATVAVTGVSLNKTATTLAVNGTETLTATVLPANATNQNVTWSSSNTSVATVNSSGLVTAVSAGNATITVTTADGSRTATCTVTVSATNISVTGVSLNKTATTLAVNGTETLTATVLPANATNQNVTWLSTDNNVATVANGLVTAVNTGTCAIIATTQDGSFTASCAVTVSATNISVTSVSLNKTATTLAVSGTETLTATILPANATNKNVTWLSTDNNVATVANGLVTAVNTGTCAIIATTQDGNFMAYCNVTVTTAITPPTVTTLAATNITSTSATLNKSVTAGSETITEQGFKYKQSSASAWTTSTSGNITGLTAGTQYQFYAYATTASGTTNGDTLTFTTSTATGIAESSSDQLSIYPNPVVNGELRIENGELKAGDKIEIYNVNGAKVFETPLSIVNYPLSINIAHLPAGEYIVKVGNRIAKVVKNN